MKPQTCMVSVGREARTASSSVARTVYATFTGAICLLSCAIALGKYQSENKHLDVTHICVPAANQIDAPGWIANDFANLKNDAVAFHFLADALPPAAHYQPAYNIFGEALPITGTVAPRRDDEWLVKLPANNYWRQIAEGPNAIVEIDVHAHQIRAFQTATRDRWMIWSIDPAYPVSPKSIETGGSVLALCHRTVFPDVGIRRVGETVTCDRRVVRDELLISYSFGGRNVGNVAALDDGLWKVIRSWRCKK